MLSAGNLHVDSLGEFIHLKEFFENDSPAIVAMNRVGEIFPVGRVSGGRQNVLPTKTRRASRCEKGHPMCADHRALLAIVDGSGNHPEAHGGYEEHEKKRHLHGRSRGVYTDVEPLQEGSAAQHDNTTRNNYVSWRGVDLQRGTQFFTFNELLRLLCETWHIKRHMHLLDSFS